MNGKEEISERLRKLLALANSDNEHEAALAMARAQALAERHEIELADLGEADTETIGEETFFDSGGSKLPSWRGGLARTICRANGCFTYRSGPRVFVSGRPSDVKRARAIFQECAYHIDRLARRHARGRGRSYATSFRLGCVAAVSAAIDAEKRRTRDELRGKVTETALVVVDSRRREAEAFTRAHIPLQSSRSRVRVGSGYGAGVSAGAGVYGSASRGRVTGGGQRLIQ
jgi:hypothetical protein